MIVANRQSYPVFVEEAVVRMIWVEADSPEHAAKQINEWPGDYDRARKNADPVDGWITGRAPSGEIGPYDWDAVYGYTGAAEEADAHVRWHEIHLRDLLRVEHAATGHPNLRERPNHRGERWCPDCRELVAPAAESCDLCRHLGHQESDHPLYDAFYDASDDELSGILATATRPGQEN